MIKQKHPLENTVAKDTFVLVAAALPGRMRPAKVRAQASCRLQFFELDHFRAIFKGQRLPTSRWQPTQTRQERLAQGDGRLVLGLGRQQKAALVLLATEQGRLVSRNADQIRSPVLKAGSARNGLWPPGLYLDRPGQQTSAPAGTALPLAGSVGAAQMTITGIAGLCGHVNPAGDTLPLLRMV